jgi:hypothetical protein
MSYKRYKEQDEQQQQPLRKRLPVRAKTTNEEQQQQDEPRPLWKRRLMPLKNYGGRASRGRKGGKTSSRRVVSKTEVLSSGNIIPKTSSVKATNQVADAVSAYSIFSKSMNKVAVVLQTALGDPGSFLLLFITFLFLASLVDFLTSVVLYRYVVVWTASLYYTCICFLSFKTERLL